MVSGIMSPVSRWSLCMCTNTALRLDHHSESHVAQTRLLLPYTRLLVGSPTSLRILAPLAVTGPRGALPSSHSHPIARLAHMCYPVPMTTAAVVHSLGSRSGHERRNAKTRHLRVITPRQPTAAAHSAVTGVPSVSLLSYGWDRMRCNETHFLEARIAGEGGRKGATVPQHPRLPRPPRFDVSGRMACAVGPYASYSSTPTMDTSEPPLASAGHCV